MSDFGNPTAKHTLTLNPGEDYVKTFRMSGAPFPDGAQLFFRFHLDPVVEWEFFIAGDTATLKVESEVADTIPGRILWQLFYTEATTPTTETEVCWGTTKRTH